MSSNTSPFSQIEAIIGQYEVELKKAQKDFDRAKKKLETAHSQVETAKDMLARLKQGGVEAPSRTAGDLVFKVISASPKSLTAKEIQGELSDGGADVDIAAIHVAADRLADSGKIGREKTATGKTYKRITENKEVTTDDDIF